MGPRPAGCKCKALHEADAGSRNPYSLAWGITAVLWWLLYTFEEPHETGAAGFIGCNNVLELNRRGYKDVIAVDNLTKSEKFLNLAKCSISDYFDKFLVQRGLKVSGRLVGKYVPSNGPLSRTVTESGLLVGDAAGHVMAVNGGGIPIAMICGRLAGRVAAEHVVKGVPLSKYEELWRQQVAKPLRTAVHTKMLASLFFGSNRRLEFSMRVLGARRMGNILRCRPSFP